MSKSRPVQIVYFLLLALLCMCKRGVTPENSSVASLSTVNGQVYTVVDQPPTFPGGQVGLGQYLMKSMRYPADAQRARLQGQVIISFIVTTTGQIVGAKVKQSVGGSCDTEALRIVKEMPAWTPGHLNGQPVNVLTSLPLNFKLI